MERYFWYDDSTEKIPEEIAEDMVSVCLYADSTGLYTDDEIDECNVAYILFPYDIVEAYYIEVIAPAFGFEPEGDMYFDRWFNEEYIADDMDKLTDFAKSRGFIPVRYTETES